MASESAKVARRAGVVAAFTFGSRILGYVRDAVLANVFGASAVYDAFIVAQTIPNILRRLVAEGSLVIAFVPLLAEAREEGGPDEMRRFTAAVLGILLPVLAILTGLGVAFPDTAVELFAAGFDPERAAIASDLTRIMMPYILFISLVALAGGALNTVGVFAAPAAAPILLNAAIITGAVVFRHQFASPIEAVAWGVVAGGVLQLLLQLPFLVKAGLLVAPRWAPAAPRVLTLGRRMLPAVFGVAVYQINIIVIRQIASFLPRGQMTWYYNATRLQEFALGVFAVSVSVAALPTLSDHAAKKDWTALRRTFRRALRITNFITVPTTVAMLVLAEPIVAVLFRHGAFTAADATQSGQLLALLAIALVPIGAVRVTVPTFYSLGDTKTPVGAAMVSLLVTLGLGVALVGPLEIHGLCIALSVAALMQLIVLWLLLQRTLHQRGATEALTDDPSVLGHALRCAIASLPAAGVAWFARDVYDWLGGSNLIGFAILAGVGVVCGALYAAGAAALRLEEMQLFIAKARRR